MSWDTTLQIDKLKRRSRHDQIRHGTHFSEIANAIDGKYCCSHENLSTMSTFTSHAPYHDKCQYGSSNPGFLGNELPRQALKHDSVICGYSTNLDTCRCRSNVGYLHHVRWHRASFQRCPDASTPLIPQPWLLHPC
jgi:hypothetical protein